MAHEYNFALTFQLAELPSCWANKYKVLSGEPIGDAVPMVRAE